MTDVWKPIPGFTKYEVSDLGQIRSQRQVLIPQSNGKGYLKVQLGRANSRYVHRLVLLAFIGEPPMGAEADHIDGDRGNNRLTNLRYLTHAENMVAIRERNPKCKQGHSYANGNEIWTRGRRQCRLCVQKRDRERWPRRKSEAVA